MNEKKRSENNLLCCYENKQSLKNITFKYIFFLLIISVITVPSIAVSPHQIQGGIPNNKTCDDCHTSHQTKDIVSGSSKISIANTPLISKYDSIQSFKASNVVGNITLISSLGQDWYQQGIKGPDGYGTDVNDKSWGWTFFDENQSGGFITPTENVTQRENIYVLLLDDGNNSNPISGAIVEANVIYWKYNGTSYFSNNKTVLLKEDTNRKGFYSGKFNFNGGTTYATEGNMCSGCHTGIFGVTDTQIGYFPGNYSVSISAQADGKTKNTNLNFEVTPWGCENCHGSGNRHRAQADMDSACYLCHGINEIRGMSDAGNPHQNTAHINLSCTDCHTNRSLNSQTFDGVTFAGLDGNKPQYKNITIQLNKGKHSTMSCIDCHNNLTLPGPQGGYGSYTVNGILNNFNPSFASLEQFEDYYIINVTSSNSLDISLEWDSAANLGFYLYPPDFNPKKGILNMPPFYDGATRTNRPEIYSNSAPKVGKWILAVYGYDLNYETWLGALQPPINYTIGSTYPMQKKDLPTTPECSNCHYSDAKGGANTKYEIPDWNPGFAHVDTNNDSKLDIQCRMCHNAMHNIVIKICQNCHTKAPINHPISDPSFTQYLAKECLACHGDPHRVTISGGTCIACHSTPTGDNIYAAIDTASFGKHKNINKTDGNDNLTDNDCVGCHYNISNMINRDLDVDTRKCMDCHIEGNFSAPIINNHKQPKMPVIAGGKISTSTYCSICHNNSINKSIYSVNASVSHYVTNESLVKTVNQTPRPRLGFMNSQEAQQYNKECNNCHNPSNSSYGNATLIKVSHIGHGTCNECHVNGNASDLHNSSLGMPVTFNCQACHTTFAYKYGASNLTGTPMAGYTSCGGGNCHYNETDSLDSPAMHNVDRTFAGTPGSTDTVYLNNFVSITVTKGENVDITSRVNDALIYGGASRIGGAEYYLDVDPGQGKGIPMDAMDGSYDALQNTWESVKATIDTNNIDGTHTIYVRGMDIGKQWSVPKSATLVVESFGYINGTVTNGITPIAEAIVSANGAHNITDANGHYSLKLSEGIYTVNASKLPEYYVYSNSGKGVTPNNTTIFNIVLLEKPTGMIRGVVEHV